MKRTASVVPCSVESSASTIDLPTNDELWMEEALRSAQRALEAGEVPVGAVVVCQGRIVGRGWNRNIADSDPTAHAEVMALREAGGTVGNHRLADCMSRLDSGDAKLIRTAFFEGSTYTELAVRAETPLGTIKSRIRRALIKLRECLG